MKPARFAPVVGLMLGLASCGSQPDGPAPPSQPLLGPGGKEYAHKGVTHRVVFEDGALGARVYEPDDPPLAAAAPVVVFLHGYQAMGEWYYAEWLNHLVRRGNVVIFPLFQERYNLPTRFEGNARHGIDAAMADLVARGVPLDRERVMFIGHSGGGALAVNLAVAAGQGNLQLRPRAMLLAAPGRCVLCEQSFGPGIPLADPRNVPADIRLAVFSYDEDWVVGDGLGEHVFNTVPIPRSQRTMLRVRSDDRGFPPLVAQHRSPAASERDQEGEFGTDALDYFGTWKVADALQACAFDGTLCDVALGEGDAQRHMGFWADGTPVRGMINR